MVLLLLCCCVVVVVCVVDIVPQVLRRACTGKTVRLYRKASVHVMSLCTFRSVLWHLFKNIYISRFLLVFIKRILQKNSKTWQAANKDLTLLFLLFSLLCMDLLWFAPTLHLVLPILHYHISTILYLRLALLNWCSSCCLFLLSEPILELFSTESCESLALIK